MRITKEMLFKIARDTATERARADRSVTAVYLHGSMLDGDPLLGGAGDIDLSFVHDDEAQREREIVRVTDEICLDISHRARKDYRQGREIRTHPWLGPELYSCKILHDPQHFLDFVQATVRGQFHRPENVLRRARTQADLSRQVWQTLTGIGHPASPGDAARYLQAVEHAANAAVSLSGAPLTERRFLLLLAPRVQALGKPGLYAAVLGLLGGTKLEAEVLLSWLPEWQAAFDAVAALTSDATFRPARSVYYRRAFEALLAGDQPSAALWPLWHNWTLAVQGLGEAGREKWQQAGNVLGLLGDAFSERVAALDAFLDLVDETLETWGRENGA